MIDALFAAAARAEARLSATLAPHDLGVGEWRVLVALNDRGPQAPSAIADALALTRGGVTRIADRLRARRLLVRAAAGRADARFQTLALTGAGATLVRDLRARVDAGTAAAVPARLAAALRAMVVLFAVLLALPAPAQPLTVMSFNVRLPMASDGANRWEARADLVAAMIRRVGPDVIGTQELFQRQGADLLARLPGYAWFGIDRRGGHADEHMGIFYDRRKLRLERFGEFWLSDTPAVPGSISWRHPFPRMVTWAVFARVKDGKRFRLLNTHFPYRAEDEGARGKAAALIAARLEKLPGAELPTVLTGDFNTGPDSEAYRVLSGRLADAWTAALKRSGSEGTFHGFKGVADRRIDWIFARGFTPLAVRTVEDRRGAVWASDHFPVVATLAFDP